MSQEDDQINVDDENTFTHQPLDLQIDSLRLIEILPSDGSDLIQCTIRHATTESTYTCLSYVWGPEEDGSKTILLNNRPLPIRRNLWDFLSVASSHKRNLGISRSRYPAFDFSQAKTSLWIDALCIDQRNVTEKNHQVQQMGDIYSHAHQVLTWLGHDEETAISFAIESINAKQLDCLWDNEYWHRAWITQELVLAKDLWFIASNRAIYYPRLLSLVQAAPKASDRKMSRDPAILEIQDSKALSRTLFQNVLRFRHKQASDLRDRVYSLLSISSDGARIRVNYGTSITNLALSLYPIPKPLCVWDVTTLEMICEILGSEFSWSELHELTWHVSATLPSNHWYHCCDTAALRVLDRERKFLMDLGLKWIEERVYCLRSHNKLRGVMKHIILGHSNTSEVVEILFIARGGLRKAPKCMTLQSLDTAGNAVFIAPIKILYEEIVDASSDCIHDCR